MSNVTLINIHHGTPQVDIMEMLLSAGNQDYEHVLRIDKEYILIATHADESIMDEDILDEMVDYLLAIEHEDSFEYVNEEGNIEHEGITYFLDRDDIIE